MHSQRLSEPPLMPWVIVESDGKVISGNCNGMAGLAEVCTHVAADLFWIEITVKMRESRTVTDKKAYWVTPSYEILFSRGFSHGFSRGFRL